MRALMLVCRHVHLCVPERCRERKKKNAHRQFVACALPLVLNFERGGGAFKRQRVEQIGRSAVFSAVICYPAPLDLHSERRGRRQGAVGLGGGRGWALRAPDEESRHNPYLRANVNPVVTPN